MREAEDTRWLLGFMKLKSKEPTGERKWRTLPQQDEPEVAGSLNKQAFQLNQKNIQRLMAKGSITSGAIVTKQGVTLL